MLLYYLIYQTCCEKDIKCSASLEFYLFFSTRLRNSIKVSSDFTHMAHLHNLSRLCTTKNRYVSIRKPNAYYMYACCQHELDRCKYAIAGVRKSDVIQSGIIFFFFFLWALVWHYAMSLKLKTLSINTCIKHFDCIVSDQRQSHHQY